MNLIQISQLVLHFQLIFQLILLIVVFIKQGKLSGQHHKLFYATTALLFCIITVAEISLMFYDPTNSLTIISVKDWINVTAIVLALSALGLMIRESKPKIARAPVALAFLPFLILAVYPFVAETFVLKRFLFLLLEGGGLLIAILMYTLHSIRDSSYRIISILLAVFGLTILVNVFTDDWVLITQFIVLIVLYVLYKTYKQKELQF